MSKSFYIQDVCFNVSLENVYYSIYVLEYYRFHDIVIHLLESTVIRFRGTQIMQICHLFDF